MWSFFAFMNDDGEQDETRRLADWQVEGAVRWASARGYDNIYLYRDQSETVRFERAAPTPVRHHMHLVEGSSEPGDEAA